MVPEQQDLNDMALANGAQPRPLAAHNLSAGQRILIILLNFMPLLHVLVIAAVAALPWAPALWRALAAIGVLYLLPALLARLIVRSCPFHATVIAPGTPDFFKWWALLSLQTLFCRLPALEEILRVVPSAYSAWLRLWGSRIGRLTYWAPGTRILDRSFLDIGDDVVFGAGVRLNPHVMARNDRGEMELLLAPVKVGHRALVGGYSLLTAGTEIADDECTRACLMSPPFSRWQRGRRLRGAEVPGVGEQSTDR